MKGTSSLVASSVALLASVAAATPSSTNLQARAASSSSSSSLPAVSVKGNAFFAGDNRFYIRGVDYQPGGSSEAKDPIADEDACNRDIKYFKQLGINTIRVYTVDNTANHDACMNALAAAGIYLALDVNTPKYSINRADPAPSFNAVYLQSVFATMDAFSKYTNTLLFFSANEVINDDDTVQAAPYVKAVGAYMKQYRTSRGMREIPIGYSAADVASSRYQLADYLNCGSDDERSDFFAFNDYSWCNPQKFQGGPWQTNVEHFSNYSIPLFLSEYGCIKTKRTFDEVEALYNQEMTSVYSGGLVYEYSEEGSGYGLVKISGNTITLKDDFDELQQKLSQTPPPSGDGGYKSSGTPSTCPGNDPDFTLKEFTGSAIPALPSDAVKYMKNGAGAGPGLTGDGSQNAGSDKVATASAGAASATVYATQSAGGSGTSASSSATSSGAAAGVAIPPVSFGVIASAGIVILSTLAGAALL